MKFAIYVTFLGFELFFEHSTAYTDNTGEVCFDVYATWISRYANFGSPSEIDNAFAKLKELGINRAYFNVWADGNIYFNSPTAIEAGGIYRGENLQWAIDAGKKYDIKVIAWFEYGTMAGFGPVLNQFGREADSKGWMLYNVVDGEKDFISNGTGAGQFTFLNPTLMEVQRFLANFLADAARYYDVDGVQLDDHFHWANGFEMVDHIPQEQRFAIMEDFMRTVRDTVKEANPSVIMSYSPSPVDFARSTHNVDWAQWPELGIVDEFLPQYYRTSAEAFEQTLDADLEILRGNLDTLYPGIRLSGGAFPPLTPIKDVDQMINITMSRGYKGASFWFIDNLINEDYIPSPNKCAFVDKRKKY